MPQNLPGGSGSHDAGSDAGGLARGSLDKEIVRRVIRRHIDAVRKCYEAVLLSKPYPSGRVVARFAIDPVGKVVKSCVASSTLFRLQAETCIVDEVLHWEFPKPLGAGWVVVDYPFVLIPTDNSSGDDNPDAG